MQGHDIFIAPSVLSADFLNYGAELDSIATADWVHYDVIDGHFAPNLTFGLEILRQTKKATDLPIDVHIMIDNPEEFAIQYVEAGADILCFHQEACVHSHRLVSQIHDAGAQAAMSLCPGTPVSTLENIIDELDMVLLMSVNPGFGGQSYIESTYGKIRELVELCDRRGVNPRIEVDGGVGVDNIGAICAAGADTFVGGSAVFNFADRAAAIADLRRAAADGRKGA